MASLFKLMKENVSEAPLEASRDADAISDEMDRIKKEESFFGKLLSAVASVSKTSQANMDANNSLWELFRAKGTEMKDQDFDHGAAICKAVQACTVIESQRQKNAELSISSLESKLSKWMKEEVKSARAISDNYNKLHRSYSNSAQKVNQVNRDKKVQLADLAVAEKKRDDLKEEWERDGRVGLQSLEHVYDKSKSTLMFALAEYVQSQLDMHTTAMTTLTKVQAHLGELVHFATQQEALQKSSVVQLQSTLKQEEKLQREIDSAPRSLHPSLLSALTAQDLYSSRCPLQASWDAKREGRSSKTNVGFDVRRSALTIGDATFHVDDILSLIKVGKTDSTKVRITFVNRENKDETLSFFSSKDREAFYEMFVLLRRGFGNSFVADSQLPVTHEEVKIWTGSWNMGDAPPDFNADAAMEAWMPRNKFDFYVLSLQESEYTPRSGYLTAEDDFFSFMRVHLGDNYLKLAGASLQHIRIVCFVSRDHYHKISNVKTATVATGLAGVIGNKGCSAITFSFFDAKFCFIGSHLAARIDRKRLEARNQNYRDILKGLASGFSTNGLSDVHHEFDYLFWIGDLNYRIDGISRDEIIAKANAKDYKVLLHHDQLLKERVVENCFLEFSEPDITFGPTYRFNRGERTWSEEKMREPAYCDRVLYKTLPAYVVRPLAYQPCHELMTSDHSPIYSTFAVAVNLPAMPHARDPMCKVTIRDVLGHDLRIINGSNGGKYSIVLQAPWITSQVQVNAETSPTDAAVPQPRWGGDIDLFPISTNRTFLAGRWIRIVVRDGKVDIGVGIVHLEDAIINQQKGIPIRWSSNLADKGRFCGRLSGSLIVSFSQNYEDPWKFRPEFGVLPSYYDLEPTKRPHAPSRATLSESDFTSQQSAHVIEGGNESSEENNSSYPSNPSSPQISSFSNANMINPAVSGSNGLTSGSSGNQVGFSSAIPSSAASTATTSSSSSGALNTSTSSLGEGFSEAARLAQSTGVSKPIPVNQPNPGYAPAPGSAPVAHVKSGARSWAASRSPRNPPAFQGISAGSGGGSGGGNGGGSSTNGAIIGSSPGSGTIPYTGSGTVPYPSSQSHQSPQSVQFTKSSGINVSGGSSGSAGGSAGGSSLGPLIGQSQASPASSPASSIPTHHFSSANRPSEYNGTTPSDSVAIGSRNNNLNGSANFGSSSSGPYGSSSLSSTPQSPSSMHASASSTTSSNMVAASAPSGQSYMMNASSHAPSSPPSLLPPASNSNPSLHSGTGGQVSPRTPASAPSQNSFVPAMNYSGGGIDMRKSARYSAGFNFNDLNQQSAGTGGSSGYSSQQAPQQTSSHPSSNNTSPHTSLSSDPSVQSSFKTALETVAENPYRGARPASTILPTPSSIEDELAELASLISSQKKSDGGSPSPRSGASSVASDFGSSPLQQAPSPSQRLSIPSSAASEADADFAKELAEFEMLLSAKK